MNREFGDTNFCGSPRKTLKLEEGVDKRTDKRAPTMELILLKGVSDRQGCALSQQRALAQLIKREAPAAGMEDV